MLPASAIFVLVFAHPDDESMFFLPTIRSLVGAGETVWFLCLTTGGYDGLGKIREKELERAGKLLGASRVIVRSDNDDGKAILDHPTKRYDKIIVAAAIRDSLSKNLRQASDRNTTFTNANANANANTTNSNRHRFVLITFDELGVSGHVNHIDTYLGVSHLMEEQQQDQRQPQTNDTNYSTTMHKEENKILLQQEQHQQLCFVEAWHLESERNVLSKYVPLLSWIFLVLALFAPNKYTHTCTFAPFVGSGCRRNPNPNNTTDNTTTSILRVFRMHNPVLNWKAMATHRSQFVWYRRLFVIFSSYTYCNKYICKKTTIETKQTRPNSKNY